MKKIIIMILLSVLCTAASFAQIWDSRLGYPASEGLGNLPWNTVSIEIESIGNVVPSYQFNDIVSVLNGKLTYQGYSWIRATSMEQIVAGDYRIYMSLDVNTSQTPRCVIFGSQGDTVLVCQGGCPPPEPVFSQWNGTYTLPPRGGTVLLELPSYSSGGSAVPVTSAAQMQTLMAPLLERVNGSVSGWDAAFTVETGFDLERGWLAVSAPANGTGTARTASSGLSNGSGTITFTQAPATQPGLSGLPITGNWVWSRTFNDAGVTMDDVTHYDGLGYTSQDIAVGGAGTAGKDLVTPHGYDLLHREPETRLPYARTTAGGAPATAAEAARQSWYGNHYPGEGAWSRALTSFESAATGRTLSVRRPGQAWNTHPATVSYRKNAANEVLNLTSESGNTLSVNGYVPSGALSVTISTDEDGCDLAVYKDRDDRTVLERRHPNTNTTADTYYVYDVAGHLSWVISPEGSTRLTSNTTWSVPGQGDVNTSDAAKYAYHYMYDERDRLVWKKLPGASRVEYVYNWADRLIAQRDGNMAADGKWKTFHYDGLGRVTEERLVTDSRSRSSLVSAYYDSEAPTAEITGGMLLRQYAYDAYPSGMASNLAYWAQYGVTTNGNVDLRDNRTKGLLCYEKVNVLGTTDYVERVYYYDRFARAIQTVEKRPGNQILRTSVKYDLQGLELVRDEALNWEDAFLAYRLRTENTYDSRGRLLSSTASLDDGEVHYSLPQMSAQYAYDDLGHLVKTTYGNRVTDSLSYDLRGWRTSQTVKRVNTDIFSSVLRYNTAGYGANACWNGNIASQGWAHRNAVQQNQGYLYDRMSRLTRVENGDVQGWPYAQEYVFDRNTNLTVKYDLDEDDEEVDMDEFPVEGNQCTDYYSYDANGNLTASGDGWTVTYNLLNLPASAVKNAGTDDEQTVEWSYLADGTKIADYVGPYVDVADEPVAVESIRPAPRGRVLGLREGEGEPVADSTEVVGGRVGYLYTGPFRISWDDAGGPQLESVASVGGRFVMATDPSNSSFTAQQRYYITDHLGSTRVVLDKVGNVLERYDYYPYGEKIDVSVANTGNTDYLYTGKESQNALFGINWYDSGARFQTTDGIFTGIDPLAEKYYHLSPYAYCAGNPVNVVDPDGRDGYLIVWATANGSVGHAGFAIDNYEPQSFTDSNGNTQTRMVKTGTLSYYDLWPGTEGGVTIRNVGKDVVAHFNVISSTDLNTIINEDITGSEEQSPDGILCISTSYETDRQTSERIEEAMKEKVYNGVSRNCSDFAKIGVESSSGTSIEARESILGHMSTTPNKLFRESMKLPGTTVIKDPGQVINNSFIQGIK